MLKMACWMLTLAVAMQAGADDKLTGYWTGEIHSGAAVTPIELRFAEVGDGLQGTWGLPRSGIREASLNEVTLKGDTASFAFEYRRIDYVFEGHLAGDTIEGQVNFEDQSMSFKLARTPWNPPYTTEDFKYENGGVTIAARLYVPEGEGPHPALVMMHGSGDNTKGRYGYWGDFFARRGVALLTADKRGCGDSTGDWNTVGFEDLARDGIEGVKLLFSRVDIDRKRVGMTGISQAGWVMVQAASMSDDVAFLLVDSGATYDVEREGYYDYEAQLGDASHSSEEIAEAFELLKMDNAVTRTGQGYDELRAKWNGLRQEPWFKNLRFFPLPADAKFRTFYKLIIDFDPRPLLETLELPILWLYGEDDKSVHASECIAILEDIDERHDKDYTIHLFPKADHGLRVPPDPAKDALPIPVYSPGYLEAKDTYVRERVLAAK